MRDTTFILLGAGKGKRFGIPKIELFMEGKPIFIYEIQKIEKLPFIKEVVLTVPKNYVKKIKKIIDNYSFALQIKVIQGGETRCESMEKAVKKSKGKFLLIHDLARPFFSLELIKKIRKALSRKDLVVPYFSPSDTVIYKEKKLKREEVKLIHTPQGVKRRVILQALKKTKRRNFPDESTLLKETLDITPFYLKDNFFNFKITFKEDFEFINKMESSYFIRAGSGFDIHRIEKGKGNFYLGGVLLKKGMRAIGHSDGDVVIHSLIDAILGAMGKGDIGDFFPDTDEKWKNKRSVLFLKRIMKIFKKEGYSFINIDITIFLDAFKLKEKKRKIRNNLSKLLEISPSIINVKAKTTEGLSENAVFAYSNILIRKGQKTVFC